MKEVKSIDVRSAFLVGLVFYAAVVGLIALLFLGAELLSTLRGEMQGMEFLVGLLLLVIGGTAYVAFGALTVAVSAWVYNKIAQRYGGVKVRLV